MPTSLFERLFGGRGSPASGEERLTSAEIDHSGQSDVGSGGAYGVGEKYDLSPKSTNPSRV